MCDLNSVLSGLVQAIDSLKNADHSVQCEGAKLFVSERTTLVEAGKSLVDLAPFIGEGNFESFCADYSEAETEVARLAELAKAETEIVANIAEKTAAITATLTKQVEALVELGMCTDRKVVLSCVPVESFISVSGYENNRDVEKRALKQAQAVANGKDVSNHETGDTVAVAMLDPVRNKALWERTEAVAKAAGIPHTLPFIKVDGHTRAYGWSTCSPFKKDMGAKKMFARPESLFVTVYRNLTDSEIYQVVQDYCNGVNKATNVELQQMGMKKIEFAPTSDFVAKDSWKTAFKVAATCINSEISTTANKVKWGTDLDAALKEHTDALMFVDSLEIDTADTKKKLSGVRAALLITYAMFSESTTIKKGTLKEFWSKFYANKTRDAVVMPLIADLAGIKVNDAAKALELCLDAFSEYAGLTPVGEETAE